jgi:hypothetical protein
LWTIIWVAIEMAEQTGPGYTTDPFKDEGGECDDAISRAFAKITGPGGLWSTWRERHITIEAVKAGLKAKVLENVPDCPPLWQDECQYWGAAMAANVAKIIFYAAVATKVADGTVPNLAMTFIQTL